MPTLVLPRIAERQSRQNQNRHKPDPWLEYLMPSLQTRWHLRSVEVSWKVGLDISPKLAAHDSSLIRTL
jgi:hypothetical protein